MRLTGNGMAKERTFQIRTGMDVVDPNGEQIGNLESILTETQSGISRFITVSKRILPVEAIETVEGESIKLRVEKNGLEAFPEREGAAIPSEADMARAYEAIGMQPPSGGA